MRRKSMVLLVSCFALALVMSSGCKKDGEQTKPAGQEESTKEGKDKQATIEQATPEGQPEQAVQPVAQDPLEALFPESLSALADAPALKSLPADTYVVGVVSNPLDIIMRVGWEKLTKKHAALYEKGVAEVTQELGYNLLSPEGLKEIGLDLSKPVGFAWFSGKDESFALFGTMANADKFKSAVYSIAGRVREKLEPRMLGDALVLTPKNDTEGCLILKGDTVIFSFSDRGDEKGLELATRLSSMQEKDSLYADETFKKFTADLKYGKDAAVYVNFGAIMKEVTGLIEGGNAVSENYAAKELKRLQDEKADPEMIKEWEQRAKEEEEWQKKYEKRRQAEKELMAMLLDPMSTTAIGLELAGAAIKLKAFTALKPDSLYRKLSRNTEGTSVLAKSLSGKPMYFGHGTIDIPAYLEIVEKVIATEGATMDEAFAMAKGMAGIDIREEVLPLLSGEFGFAVTGVLDQAAEEPDAFFKQIGGTVLLGIADAGKTMTLLGRLVDLAFVAPFIQKNDAVGGYTVNVPDWRAVYVGCVNNYLVASTDLDFFARLKEGKEGDFIANAGPELKQVLLSEDNAAWWTMDMALFSTVFIRGKSMDWDENAVAREADEEIPYSEEYRKIEKELEEARGQAKKLRREVQEKEDKLIYSIVNRIGTTAAVGRFTEEGMVAYGGQFFNDESLEAFVEHMVDDGMAMYQLDETDRRKVWKLEDKRWELDRKLQEQRAKDIQEHYEKKTQEAAQPAPAVAKEPEE